MFYKTNKYGNKKIEVDGITYDSKKEYYRHQQLLMHLAAGAITNLERQKQYILIPAQREPDQVGKRGGIIKGKLIERECCYYADFVYYDVEKGETVVEDTKGMRTKDYIIKRKLMLYVHGIRISEL